MLKYQNRQIIPILTFHGECFVLRYSYLFWCQSNWLKHLKLLCTICEREHSENNLQLKLYQHFIQKEKNRYKGTITRSWKHFNRPKTFAFGVCFLIRRSRKRDQLLPRVAVNNLRAKGDVNNEAKIFRIEPDSNLPSKAKLLNKPYSKNLR